MISKPTLEVIRTTAERKLKSGCETMVLPTREVLALVREIQREHDRSDRYRAVLGYYTSKFDNGLRAITALDDEEPT